jgi:hypothetical protein
MKSGLSVWSPAWALPDGAAVVRDQVLSDKTFNSGLLIKGLS